MQPRLESLLESVLNVVLGFGVAIAAQYLVFPLFGIHVPMSAHLGIGAAFTVISLIRSYLIRRWFNGKLQRLAHSLATAAR